MNPSARVAVIAVIVAAVGGTTLLLLRKPRTPPRAPVPEARTVKPPPRPVLPPPPPAAPAIRHPLARAESQPKDALPSPAEADAYIKGALIELLGRKSVVTFLRLDDSLRRFVVTVDNLAREHAAAQLWPVHPTSGAFAIETDAAGTGTTIGTKNATRYAALVHFIEAIDTAAVVALYKRLYPLFDEEYQDIGYPGQYFNDRVVQVIDDLLATPDIARPIRVRAVKVDGAVKPSAVGGLYLFEDPALERRSAGQKILLRVGRDNAARLKAKLVDIRRQVATGVAPPPDDKQ